MAETLWFQEVKDTPLGCLTLYASTLGVCGVHFGPPASLPPEVLARFNEGLQAPATLAAAVTQVQEYLTGQRKAFALELDWRGLPAFQAAALRLAMEIPYGQTRTYGELAAGLGKPGAARAVGTAMARNPMPLILPCHRVVGSDGKMHGYSGAGGVETKAWLLRLEGNRL